mgnify:CR=1 FL=1
MCHSQKATDIEDIVNKLSLTPESNTNFKDFVIELSKYNFKTRKEYDDTVLKLRRQFEIPCVKKTHIVQMYTSLKRQGIIKKPLSRFAIKRITRSSSGILPVTIVLRPDKFSC